jgi:hypothetical protein
MIFDILKDSGLIISTGGWIYLLGVNRGQLKRLEEKTQCITKIENSISIIQTDIEWIKKEVSK